MQRCARPATGRSRLCLQFQCRARRPTRAFHSKSTSHEAAGQSPPPVPTFLKTVGRPGVLRQSLFVVGTSLAIFGGAATLTNWDTRFWQEKLSKTQSGGFPFLSNGVSSQDMKRARTFELVERARQWLRDLQQATIGLPTTLRYTIVHFSAQFMQTWINTPESFQVCMKVVALNTAVFIAWHIPRLSGFMDRYFLQNPLSGRSIGLLTSMFSHKGLVHLAFNMIALSSFGKTVFMWMESTQTQSGSRLTESTAMWHFLAFTVAAGLGANLVSHIAAARLTFPRAIKELSSKSISQLSALKAPEASLSTPSTWMGIMRNRELSNSILPSLGASGAVYSMVVLSAFAFPDINVSLIFPPTPGIPIQYAVGGLVLLDMFGVWRRWKVFDHYAHLGGAAFGALYYKYGAQFWEQMRMATL